MLEQTAQKYIKKKKTKGHPTAAIGGVQRGFAAGQGRAGRVFRTGGVGVGDAFVARCVGMWATARWSPTNVIRAF